MAISKLDLNIIPFSTQLSLNQFDCKLLMGMRKHVFKVRIANIYPAQSLHKEEIWALSTIFIFRDLINICESILIIKFFGYNQIFTNIGF